MQIFGNALQQSPYRRFLPLYALVGVLLLLSFITRIALLARPDSALTLTVPHLAHIFGVGLLFDLLLDSCLPCRNFSCGPRTGTATSPSRP